MTERNSSIDFIRLIAIIGVVVIHVSTAFIDKNDPYSFNFIVLHFINQSFRFAVPLFFAISGFLLGARYHSIKSPVDFYSKRLSKVLLPYVTWFLIYYIIIFPNPINSIFTTKFFNSLLRGDASYQLYFIPAIIILYIFFPIVVKNKNIFLTKRFILFLFFTEAIVLFFAYYKSFEFSSFAPIRHAFYNLLPFILGIYFGVKNIDLFKLAKNNIHKIFSFKYILVFILFFESLVAFYNTGATVYLRNQWRLTVMTYGIIESLFLYYLHVKYLTQFDRWITYFAKYSFGVFFVHVAILHYILLVFGNLLFHNLIAFSIALVITISTSFAISIGLSKIKIADRLLGLRG